MANGISSGDNAWRRIAVDAMSEADRQFMTVAIRADENTRMGIITDVKQELRRCSALKIMYSARKAAK